MYLNETEDRAFLALDVQLGFDVMLELVSRINTVLTRFSLPTYYDPPRFHLSFASGLATRDAIETALKQSQKQERAFVRAMAEIVEDSEAVERVLFKVPPETHSLALL